MPPVTSRTADLILNARVGSALRQMQLRDLPRSLPIVAAAPCSPVPRTWKEWRRREDSNPRCLAAIRFSKPMRSAALPRLRVDGQSTRSRAGGLARQLRAVLATGFRVCQLRGLQRDEPLEAPSGAMRRVLRTRRRARDSGIDTHTQFSALTNSSAAARRRMTR